MRKQPRERKATHPEVGLAIPGPDRRHWVPRRKESVRATEGEHGVPEHGSWANQAGKHQVLKVPPHETCLGRCAYR